MSKPRIDTPLAQRTGEVRMLVRDPHSRELLESNATYSGPAKLEHDGKTWYAASAYWEGWLPTYTPFLIEVPK